MFTESKLVSKSKQLIINLIEKVLHALHTQKRVAKMLADINL